MRAAFGLAALLVTLGVIVMLFKINHPADTVRVGRQLEQQVAQTAGQGTEGISAKDSIRLSPETGSDGRVKYVLVDKIIAGGPMANYYGLQQDDSIIALIEHGVDFPVREMDGEEARLRILQAYQTRSPLIVVRKNRTITLPHSDNPDNPSSGSGNAIQRQLDAISIPGAGQ